MIEDRVYISLINEYGANVKEEDKERAKELFRQYIDKYASYESLYWSLWKLGNRDLVENAGLFLSNGLYNEVQEIIKEEKSELNLSLYKMLENTFCYGFRHSIQGAALRDNLEEYFTQNTRDELKAAYIKYWISEKLKYSSHGTYARGQ